MARQVREVVQTQLVRKPLLLVGVQDVEQIVPEDVESVLLLQEGLVDTLELVGPSEEDLEEIVVS
jgi:hypothetical protein